MKKAISLAVGAAAMVVLSGCNMTGIPGTGSSVDIDDLFSGYKISGWDSSIGKNVDLCFKGSGYVYGRGAEYFDGTYTIRDGVTIVFSDATDGGSYTLPTDTGLIEKNVQYEFGGLTNNILVDTIATSTTLNDCRVDAAKNLRVLSSPSNSMY